MSPRHAALALVFLPALCIPGRPACAGEDFLVVTGGNVGIFPGAAFKKMFRFPKTTVVAFETGEPAVVAAFSKKDLAGRNRSSQVRDVGRQAASLPASRNGYTCTVAAQRGLPGRTGCSVDL